MRRLIRDIVPSMYQRRLLLLAAVVVVAGVVLTLRLAELTIVHGATWRQRAESSLERSHLVPTERGRILDRHLRVIAEDRPSYDLAVHYSVIDGSWARRRADAAFRAARKSGRRAARHPARRVAPDGAGVTIDAHRRDFEARVQRFWSTLSRVGPIERTDLEDRLATIRRRVRSMVSAVRSHRKERWALDLDEAVVQSAIVAPIEEQTSRYAVLVDLDDAARHELDRLITGEGPDAAEPAADDLWSHVAIVPGRKRYYPVEAFTLDIDRSRLPSPLQKTDPHRVTVRGVGIHLIGALRSSWREQSLRPFDRRDDPKGYLPGDLAGEWGLERSFEAHLRGTRGQIVEQLDTKKRTRFEPIRGRDVVSTVDIHLQARIEALMDPAFGLMRVQPWHSRPPSPSVGMPLRGAAVVIDVAQGQILAAVSVPSFTRARWEREAGAVRNDTVDRPFWNRAVYMPYQPGSTIKPVVLAAAMTEGVLAPDDTIKCRGHLLAKHKDRYRCWYYKLFGLQHDELDAAEAVGKSCNIFFYTLGRRLGPRRLVRWYGRFGLGRRPGSGLVEESRGRLPDLARADDTRVPGFTPGHAILMGIGQGPVEWTVLQAANAYATLARGGYALRPTFVIAPPHGDEATASEDLGLSPDGVASAQEGMRRAAGERYGTTHHLVTLNNEPIFNIDGAQVLAKSGTAMAARFRDRNRNGILDEAERWVDLNTNQRRDAGEQAASTDHAWCVALVRPADGRRGRHAAGEFVVAVVVEYAGSGGHVAGPIANQIMHALRVEGYL